MSAQSFCNPRKPNRKPCLSRFLWSFLASSLFLAGLTSPAKASVIFNDSFLDGERLIQALPNSSHWYTGGPSSNVSVTDGMLTFADASAGKATAMAYFNKVTLQVGQSLSLSFDYRFSQVANSDNSFMFGLYDSGGSYQTKDAVGFNNAIFNNYTGYATSGVFGNDPSGPGRDHIEARDLTGHNLLSIGTYTEGMEYLQSGAATPGQIYTASMQIARTAEGITVQSKIGNTVMIQKYTTQMFSQFDTVGVFSNGNSGTFAIDNVKLDYNGIPEPSPLFAMALFGLVVFGRSFSHKILWNRCRKWLKRR